MNAWDKVTEQTANVRPELLDRLGAIRLMVEASIKRKRVEKRAHLARKQKSAAESQKPGSTLKESTNGDQ